MADPCGILPFPVICIQCGTGEMRGRSAVDASADRLRSESVPREGRRAYVRIHRGRLHGGKNWPVHTIASAAQSDSFQIVCWPASIFCGCCATETGKKCVDRYPMALRHFADGDDRMLGAPADTSGQVNNAIPF